MGSKWLRLPQQGSARRGDGAEVKIQDEYPYEGRAWFARYSGDPELLPVPSSPSFLEDAIEAADSRFPPLGWRESNGSWATEGWLVAPESTGWVVLRDRGSGMERASRRVFRSADRARCWAEFRFDRRTLNLRGPKPRAEEKSTAKLPDVRVTPREKDEAIAVVRDLGLTYSEFARACVQFAAGGSLAVERSESGGPRLVPADVHV